MSARRATGTDYTATGTGVGQKINKRSLRPLSRNVRYAERMSFPHGSVLPKWSDRDSVSARAISAPHFTAERLKTIAEADQNRFFPYTPYSGSRRSTFPLRVKPTSSRTMTHGVAAAHLVMERFAASLDVSRTFLFKHFMFCWTRLFILFYYIITFS